MLRGQNTENEDTRANSMYRAFTKEFSSKEKSIYCVQETEVQHPENCSFFFH